MNPDTKGWIAIIEALVIMVGGTMLLKNATSIDSRVLIVREIIIPQIHKDMVSPSGTHSEIYIHQGGSIATWTFSVPDKR